MAFHTFGPGLALDHITMNGIPATIGRLVDAETGDVVQAFTMDDEPVETPVMTNRYGYFGQFQVPDTVRRLRMTFNHLTLEHTAWELVTESADNAADSAAASQASQQAAEVAASLVEAPADVVVAGLIDTRGTATQRVLHGLYGARGNTFVQPTAPPLGTTYEWLGTSGNSISIKKINGVEVARNHDVNGLPHSLSGWEKTSAAVISIVEDEGQKAVSVSPQTPSTNAFYAWQTDATVDAVGWVAIRAEIKALDTWTAEKFRIVIQGSGTPQTVHDKPVELNKFTEIIVTMPVGPGTLRRHFWPVNNLVDKVGFLVRNSRTAIASTELEALAQVRDYFDGSTPDDHQHDVWFNTTDNREYFWDSTTHTWTPRPSLDVDASVAGLVTGASATRTALDNRFGTTVRRNDVTNSGIVRTALDNRFGPTVRAADVTTAGVVQTALDNRFGKSVQDANTAAALQAPGAVRDAFSDALRHYGVPRAQGSPGARLVFGAIRNYGSAGGYWQPIDDSGHDPVGIASMETLADRITINTTPTDGTIVGGTLIAVTDETLAKNGYFVGGSGGGSTTHLMLGRNYSVSDRIWWTGSTWEAQDGTTFTWTWNSPTLRLFPTQRMRGSNAASIDWHGTGTAGQFVTPVIVAQTEVEIAIQFFDASGSRISSMHNGCRFYIHINDSMIPGQIDPRDVEFASGNIWFMLAQTYR